MNRSIHRSAVAYALVLVLAGYAFPIALAAAAVALGWYADPQVTA